VLELSAQTQLVALVRRIHRLSVSWCLCSVLCRRSASGQGTPRGAEIEPSRCGPWWRALQSIYMKSLYLLNLICSFIYKYLNRARDQQPGCCCAKPAIAALWTAADPDGPLGVDDVKLKIMSLFHENLLKWSDVSRSVMSEGLNLSKSSSRKI
jgi:hypothetical protein